MPKITKTTVFVALLLLIAAGLRFYGLDKVPASINRDEAAIGYNAYLILKTGKDEWGKTLPLLFKSIGDYKSPFYIYLTVIPTWLFGLGELAVKFWSAVSGMGLSFLAYLLTLIVFRPVKEKKTLAFGALIAIVFSSWGLHYSRIGFEANLSLFFNIAALYFILKNNKIDIIVTIFILFSLFTYSTTVILWLFFLLVYGLLNFKTITANKRQLSLLLLSIGIVLGFFWVQQGLAAAKSQITIFNNIDLNWKYNQLRTSLAASTPWLASLLNRYVYMAGVAVTNYFKFFNPKFLFAGGGYHPWHKINLVGHFYWIDIVLILLGLFFLYKSSKIKTWYKKTLLAFFLLGLVPAALTVDAPHATRSLNSFYLLSLLSGWGIGSLLVRVKQAVRCGSKLLYAAPIVIFFLSFGHYLYAYYYDYAAKPPQSLLPGIKEIINNNQSDLKKADEILVDCPQATSSLYVLFYSRYDPDEYFATVKRYGPSVIGFEEIERVGKYAFVENPQYTEGRSAVKIICNRDGNWGCWMEKNF
jgi:4-amino-4-deoxy-L-arabinose transferase-like glycosyltransferase